MAMLDGERASKILTQETGIATPPVTELNLLDELSIYFKQEIVSARVTRKRELDRYLTTYKYFRNWLRKDTAIVEAVPKDEQTDERLTIELPYIEDVRGFEGHEALSPEAAITVLAMARFAEIKEVVTRNESLDMPEDPSLEWHNKWREEELRASAS